MPAISGGQVQGPEPRKHEEALLGGMGKGGERKRGSSNPFVLEGSAGTRVQLVSGGQEGQSGFKFGKFARASKGSGGPAAPPKRGGSGESPPMTRGRGGRVRVTHDGFRILWPDKGQGARKGGDREKS